MSADLKVYYKGVEIASIDTSASATKTLLTSGKYCEADIVIEYTTGPAYTNLVPTSVDANGNIFNSVGYKDGYRINSGGAESGGTGISVTGFIPYTPGQTIRLGGSNILFDVYGCMMFFYKADKSAISGLSYDKVGNSNFGTWDTTEANTTFAYTPASGYLTDAACFRISANVSSAGNTGAGMIVTINEPIA